jgi:hypothetical protein
MRYLLPLVYVSFICNLASATDTASAGVTATFDPFLTLEGRAMVDVRFTNAISKAVVLSTNCFSLVAINNNTVQSILGIGSLQPETNIDGKAYCKGVYLIGDFDRTKQYKLVVQFPGDAPVNVIVSVTPTSPSSSSNNPAPWVRYVGNHMAFSILPFDANGNGSLGLQYTFAYNISKYPTLGANGESLLKFDVTSKGEFGVHYGSTATTNVQDSLTAEMDLKYLANLAVPNPIPSSEFKTTVYPVGGLVSPVGFEWNKEFSLGNYTPKMALGGAIPYLDYPAMWWSSLLQLTNSFTAPTLFSGVTYVDAIATNSANAQVAKVHERWDTEFIYDFPILNKVSFRATWNSYVGIDHPLWKYYYQVGAVYYVAKDARAANGLFFGYASGEQPPAYTKTGSWRLGYAIQF